MVSVEETQVGVPRGQVWGRELEKMALHRERDPEMCRGPVQGLGEWRSVPT